MAPTAIAVPRLHEPRKFNIRSIAMGIMLAMIGVLLAWVATDAVSKTGAMAEQEQRDGEPVGIVVPLSERSPAEQEKIHRKADRLLAKERAKHDWLVGRFEEIQMLNEPLSRTEPGPASLMLKLASRRCVRGVRVSADGPRVGSVVVGGSEVAVGGNPSGASYKTVIFDKPQEVETIIVTTDSTMADRLTVYSLELYCQR